MSDQTSNDIPRRIDMLRLTPAEKAIVAAVQAVEEMGADVLLTEAVVLLQQARDCVAAYVDEQLRDDAEPDYPR